MTHYLHNNNLFKIDRMPPDNWLHPEGHEWTRFRAYLSTLQPMTHELKGEGIVILDRDFKWDLRGVGDPLYGSTGQPSYKAWQRVAVPIEAKEQAGREEVEDLQIQVRDHIKQHDLFDWHEALSEEEMMYLQNLLLTFGPVFPEGSIGESRQPAYKKLQTLLAAPSSVSNPVAKELKQIRDAFQWTFDNMGTPHTSDHFNVPANAIEQLDNLIALFTSQHGEQETENKWMEAGLRLVAELYKKHRFILKNLDVANEDKNIFLYRLGISTEHMDNH